MTAESAFILGRQALAVAGACLGAYLAVALRAISHRTLCVLISFAAGALLAVTIFDIIPETLRELPFFHGVLSVLAGYFFFWVVTRFVSHVCPACAATHMEADFKAITLSMIVALSIHSVMDGLAVMSSSGLDAEHGLEIFLAVFSHKIPEGMALALVARGSGMSRAKAFGVTAGLELATTAIGTFVGFLWVTQSPVLSQYVLGFVGGGFLYIVLHALLSEIFKHHPKSTVVAALAGASLLMAVGRLASHAH